MTKRRSVSKKRKVQHHHFFYGGLLAFFTAGGLLAGVIIMQQVTNGSFSRQLHTFKPGQVIANAFYDVRIDKVSRSAGNPKSLTPHDGKEFLVVDMYIKNKTSKVAEIFPSSQSYIKDDKGQIYGLGVADVESPFLAGDLSPGDNIKGNLVYEIPTGLKQPKLYFEGLASQPVVVQLQ